VEFFIRPKETEILIDALDTYGVRNQEDMLIEEMSELTKALMKHRRYNTDETLADILEEIADVEITLMQLVLVYGNPIETVEAKLERLKGRVAETKREAFRETSKNILEILACRRLDTE
jgi:NTP pyrophosphatase (non-canonical NTP hydrolase)